MIKKIFLISICTTIVNASSICLDGIGIDNIDINKLSITMSGNEPMWEGKISNGSTFSFNSSENKAVNLFFSKDSHLIFFETKDKSMFGKIVLNDKCIKNEDGNYRTEVVIGNRLYIDEFTFLFYSISKVYIYNKRFKSLYSFCKTTGIKESEIRALNPWINKEATNIPANAEIVVPVLNREGKKE